MPRGVPDLSLLHVSKMEGFSKSKFSITEAQVEPEGSLPGMMRDRHTFLLWPNGCYDEFRNALM